LARNDNLTNSVVANGFGGAALLGFFGQSAFFRRDWLPINKGESCLFITFEEIGRGVPTQIAINAA
jgi:hypothetical protein